MLHVLHLKCQMHLHSYASPRINALTHAYARTHTYIYVFRYVCMYVIMYTHTHKECARVLLQTDEHPAHGIFVYVVYIQIYV